MTTLRDLQQRMAALGLSPGPIDGKMGPMTLGAVDRALKRLEDAGEPAARKLDDPAWLSMARSYIGEREIKGARHNPLILGWWEAIGAAFRDDETPWCGAFVGGVLREAGYPAQNGGAAARAWLKYGVPLDRPAYGCIVIFWRGSRNGWSGHVGFVVGQDRNGNLMVLGGNQSDAVNVKPFSRSRLLGYRWPGKWPYRERFDLPLLNSDGKLSVDEA